MVFDGGWNMLKPNCCFTQNSEHLSVLLFFKGRCVELPKNLLALHRKQEKNSPLKRMMFGRWHFLFILGGFFGGVLRNLRVPLPKPKVWKTIPSIFAVGMYFLLSGSTWVSWSSNWGSNSTGYLRRNRSFGHWFFLVEIFGLKKTTANATTPPPQKIRPC